MSLKPEYARRLQRPLPIVGSQVYANGISYIVIARNQNELTHNYPRFRVQTGHVPIESFQWQGSRRVYTIRSDLFPNPQESLGGMGRSSPTPLPPPNPQSG